MRLITTFDSVSRGMQFASYLNQHSVDSQAEIVKETDWGKESYGTECCHIWVINEEQVDQATSLLKDFEEVPTEDANTSRKVDHSSDVKINSNQRHERSASQGSVSAPFAIPPIGQNKIHRGRNGTVTLFLALLCTLLFLWSQLTAPHYATIPSYLPSMAVLSSPITKKMLFDYPEHYALADRLVKLIGMDKLETPDTLSPEGQYLILHYLNTPYWKGFYGKLLEMMKEPDKGMTITAPLFERIHDGEVWRLVTPALLHNDLFHLLFNLAWLLLLGRQLESRMGRLRYILFMIICGIVSNIAQYLMGGSNFIGFSGILCGMIFFVWYRQKNRPWEGYHLHKSSMAMVTIFILAMAAIQMGTFITEIYSAKGLLVPGIANTAHLSGAATGYILSKLNLFSWKSSV